MKLDLNDPRNKLAQLMWLLCAVAIMLTLHMEFMRDTAEKTFHIIAK